MAQFPGMSLPNGHVHIEDSAEREAWSTVFVVPTEPAWRIEHHSGRVVHSAGGTWTPSESGTYRVRAA